MSIRVELDPVQRVTAAAVGEPGERTFYLQARKDDVMVTLLLEKQQVAMLSAHIDELLGNLGAAAEAGTEPGPEAGPDPESLDLEEPIVPEFRVGRIGLGYDEERELVLMQCDEYQPESEEGAEESGEPVLETPDGQLRLWATRAQMNALARRAEIEVAGGRPICSMCGEPMDPSGHFCPRSNGHQEVTRLT